MKDTIRRTKVVDALQSNDFGKKINVPTYINEHLKDGFKDIINIMEKGDIVLLSPASASWDQYKECEVRGAEFKELVRGINGIN